jgi:hypothetical protein
LAEDEIAKLKMSLKLKEETIKLMNDQNKNLQDKLNRIKVKMKKFVKSYKLLKVKLESITKLSKINVSDDLTKQLSGETLDLHKKKNLLNSSYFVRKSVRHGTDKFEDNSFTNANDISVSLAATDCDFIGDRLRNRSDLLSKSVDQKNENFSFRSTENFNLLVENTAMRNNSQKELVKVSKSEVKNTLDLIKIRTKNILELYQKRFENFKITEI